MQWINTKQSYGWLSIVLHWLAAFSVIYMLWLGFQMDSADEAHNRALHWPRTLPDEEQTARPILECGVPIQMLGMHYEATFLPRLDFRRIVKEFASYFRLKPRKLHFSRNH